MVSCNVHIIYLSLIMSHFIVRDAIHFSLFLRAILFTFHVALQCFFRSSGFPSEGLRVLLSWYPLEWTRTLVEEGRWGGQK